MPIDAKWLPLGGAYRKESPIKMPTGSQRRLLSRGGSMPIDAKWLPLGVAYREENPIKKSHTHTHTHTLLSNGFRQCSLLSNGFRDTLLKKPRS